MKVKDTLIIGTLAVLFGSAVGLVAYAAITATLEALK